jgi:hypothetical protein
MWDKQNMSLLNFSKALEARDVFTLHLSGNSQSGVSQELNLSLIPNLNISFIICISTSVINVLYVDKNGHITIVNIILI